MQSPKTLSSSAPRLVRSRALENVDYLDSRAPRASARSTLSRGHEDGRDVWGDALNAALAGTSLMTPRSVAGASQRIATSPGVHDAQLSRGHVAQLSRGHVAHDAELSRGRVAADDAPPTNSISESQTSTVSYVASQEHLELCRIASQETTPSEPEDADELRYRFSMSRQPTLVMGAQPTVPNPAVSLPMQKKPRTKKVQKKPASAMKLVH